MPVTEESRHRLHQKLHQTIGPEDATTLMEHLPPTGCAVLPTKEDITLLRSEMNQRFDRVDDRSAYVDQRFDQVDQRLDRMDRRFERLEGRLEASLDRMDVHMDKMIRHTWKVIWMITVVASLLMAATKYL